MIASNKPQNIFAILNGTKQFLIPIYQRYYSWTEKQCTRLWDDIVEMQTHGKKEHFIGTIVDIAEVAQSTMQKFMIIDGQQRVTTLIIMLVALRNYAIETGNNFINAEEVENTYLKNAYKKDDEHYKLILTQKDKDALLCLIENKPFPESVNNSKIFGNLKFFDEKIKSNELPPEKIFDALGKLLFVEITLDRENDDPQEIFESLNSTGLDLSQSDLIRNYILMRLDVDEQNFVYEHFWHPMENLFNVEKAPERMDRFFRDYLTMKLSRVPKIDRIYEEFKSFSTDNKTPIRKFCKELFDFAKIYTDIIFKKSDNQKVKTLYEDIVDLKMEVSYPFLLKVHADKNAGKITENDLIEILSLCESCVLRRNICDLPSNVLNKMFASMGGDIVDDDYMNSVRATFILKTGSAEFPDDKRFSSEFEKRDIYNMKSRNFILSHLENFESKNFIKVENCTIEHIMPQNAELSPQWQKELGENWSEIQKEYLHTIGNLTLTKYNSEMSDKPFAEKMNMKGGFKQSPFSLNESIVTVTHWNERAIKNRAVVLSQKAAKIWTYPKIEKSILEKYRAKQSKQNYSLDSYNFNTTTKKLFDMLDARVMNLSPDVRKEFTKFYIVYKVDVKFIDVEPFKDCLKIFLNVDYSEIFDPTKICRDVSNIGHHGTGNVEARLKNVNEIDNVMDLIKQAFNAQNNDE